jgi:hypothetical protein
MRTAVVVPGNGAVAVDGEYRITELCRQLVVEAERQCSSLSPVAVVFSGWSPLGGQSEADQMRCAWRGQEVELVVEPKARTTVENASRTLPLLLERQIECAVVVCSSAHLLRVRICFGGLYKRRGIRTRFKPLVLMPTLGSIAWELGGLALLPWQLSAARSRLVRGSR